jgi:hypothetical protein
MSQPAHPDPAWALGACDSPSPVPLAHPRHRSPARRWITMACLTLAIVLTPAAQLAVWIEGTLLSTSGFVAALGPLPRDPAMQNQLTAQIDRQLKRASGALPSPLAALAEGAAARAVPAFLGSHAFLQLWRTALAATHHQLMLVLRGRSQLLAITGSALTVDVPVAAGTLIKAVGLPHQLERLLPTAIPVSVTILDNSALGQARTAVHLTDILSRLLPAAALALALAGLAADRRRRALLCFLIPVTALGILGALAVHLLTRTAGSPLVTHATGALTAPLTGQLILTSAICAAAIALLLAAPRLMPHPHPDASALLPRKERHRSSQ